MNCRLSSKHCAAIRSGRFLATAGTVVWLLVLTTGARAQQPFEVVWANERLTVRAADASRADVLREVARQAGMEVTGVDNLSGRLTVEFANLPVYDALRQLLSGVNYAVSERNLEGGGRKIVISVHSAHFASTATGPIFIPALEAIAADDVAQEPDGGEPPTPEEEEDMKNEAHSLMEMEASGVFTPGAELEELVELLEHDNKEIRQRALTALSQHPAASPVPPMIRALADEDPAVRQIAVNYLGQLKDSDSLRRVAALLEKETNTAPRVAALRVVAFRADPASQVFLRGLVKDPDPTISDAVVQILQEFERRAKPSAATVSR